MDIKSIINKKSYVEITKYGNNYIYPKYYNTNNICIQDTTIKIYEIYN